MIGKGTTMPAKAITETWPTMAEFDEVSLPLDQAVEDMNGVVGRVRRLDDRLDRLDDSAQPTLEQLGALSVFIAQVEHDVETASGFIEALHKTHRFVACGVTASNDDAS
jgi:hypothetical protein